MSMYHPGRVIEVFSPSDKNIQSSDNATQVMLDMWDDNLITVSVEAHISNSIKKDDIVLVDYSTQKLIASKILKGVFGKSVWTKYKDFFSKRKGKSIPQQQKVQQYLG